MSTPDIITRADAINLNCNVWERIAAKCDLWSELVAALKARYNASELSEDVIAHVLADIDQVSDEESWSLRQRLETIQKICDGSEYR